MHIHKVANEIIAQSTRTDKQVLHPYTISENFDDVKINYIEAETLEHFIGEVFFLTNNDLTELARHFILSAKNININF